MIGRLDAQEFCVALDHATDGVLIERNGEVVYINARYAAILGYSDPEELIGLTIRDLVYPADCERLLDFGRRRELGEKAPIRYTFRISSRDGTPVALAASVSVARPGNDTLITTIVRETVLEKSLDIDQMTLAGWNRLASREREVITLLLEGQRPKEIALLLDISEKTVATHRRRALVKLNVEDDFTLFRFAVRHGLLQI